MVPPHRHHQREDDRQHAGAAGAPRSRSEAPARRSCRARRSGCRATASPTPAPTSPASRLLAVRDGDEWVLNGQKIWTSRGMDGTDIFVLARTDPDVPKHRGITFLLCPLPTPGVEVRQITHARPATRVLRGVLRRRPHPDRRTWSARSTTAGRSPTACSATSGARRRRPTRSSSAPSSTGSSPLARDKGVAGDPSYPPPAGVVPHEGRDDALPRATASSPSTCATACSGPRRRSRSCTGASTTRWSSTWRWRCSAPTPWCARGGAPTGTSAPTSPARRTRPTRGSTCSCSTPAAARSTPARREIQRNILGESILGLPKEPRPGSA